MRWNASPVLGGLERGCVEDQPQQARKVKGVV